MENSSDSNPIVIESSVNQVRWITLNLPQHRNPLSTEKYNHANRRTQSSR